MKKTLIGLVAVALVAGLVALTACTQTEVIEVTREVEKEVRVEVTRVVKVDRPIEVTRVVEIEKKVEVFKRYEVAVTATPTPIPELSKPAVMVRFDKGGPDEVECNGETIPLIRQKAPKVRDYVSKGKCWLDDGVYTAYAGCNDFGNNHVLLGGHFRVNIYEPDDIETKTHFGGWKETGIPFHLKSSYLIDNPVRFESDRYRVNIDTSCSDGWLHLHKDARLIMVQE